jgi:hypothetical protein
LRGGGEEEEREEEKREEVKSSVTSTATWVKALNSAKVVIVATWSKLAFSIF